LAIHGFKDYYLRMRRASAAELLYRAKQTAGNAWLKYRFWQGRLAPDVPETDAADLRSLNLPAFDCRLERMDIEKILAGEKSALNSDEEEIRRFESRHSDQFFSSICWAGNEVDIQAAWEPARLQHLAASII
jgi:hypothetical protein